MGQARKGKKQLKVTSGTYLDIDLSDDELIKQNLPFLRTTCSGRNISINKKYGV